MKKEYMTPKEVARYDPYNMRVKPAKEAAKKLLEEPSPSRTVETVMIPTETTTFKPTTPEQAKEILGKDFLGVETIRTMEDKLKAAGVVIRFKTDPLPPFPYSEKDLEFAKKNGEMLVLRTEWMTGGRQPIPVTLINFQMLFSGNSFQKLFNQSYDDIWYKDLDFSTRTGEIKSQWALEHKSVIYSDIGQTWPPEPGNIFKKYQNELKQADATNTAVDRRTATEIVWDTILYYLNTDQRLLEKEFEQSKSVKSHNRSGIYIDYPPVYVGYFDSSGLAVFDFIGINQPKFGVCPTR